MATQEHSYSLLVHTALARTAIGERLSATGAAIVLERIAMGGGATRWYRCRNSVDLSAIEVQLRPGSVVSFYFDDRFRSALYSDAKASILRIAAETGDCVVGVLCNSSVELIVQFVTGGSELAELESESVLTPSTLIIYGAFPDRENDGLNAVSLALPDHDGVVRGYPH